MFRSITSFPGFSAILLRVLMFFSAKRKMAFSSCFIKASSTMWAWNLCISLHNIQRHFLFFCDFCSTLGALSGTFGRPFGTLLASFCKSFFGSLRGFLSSLCLFSRLLQRFIRFLQTIATNPSTSIVIIQCH